MILGSGERGVRVGRGNGRVHGDEKGFENDGYFASARVGGGNLIFSLRNRVVVDPCRGRKFFVWV